MVVFLVTSKDRARYYLLLKFFNRDGLLDLFLIVEEILIVVSRCLVVMCKIDKLLYVKKKVKVDKEWCKMNVEEFGIIFSEFEFDEDL